MLESKIILLRKVEIETDVIAFWYKKEEGDEDDAFFESRFC